ncbi:ATP-dependent DNA helicase RecQ, partial [Bittarella massiliensis]|nr:ATP-dependent DNA helicase RecQ [Bittarella massiliensis (ex Durand et al. 2017)]
HDFRPSYLQIPVFLEALPRRPVLAAFTATATAAVQGDVLKILGLQDPLCITTGFDRQNLYFGVETPKYKMDYVRQYVRQNGEKSGIVYCSTRKAVEQVCQ